ncbi:hypothetical protein Tco_1002410 [Tanacetum coccineum]|uniref:Uncharacterized protein n=1 Tax=Tanacetum coccineum TaxID=301880 RepID=A0ABQ5F6H2_9ASTR
MVDFQWHRVVRESLGCEAGEESHWKDIEWFAIGVSTRRCYVYSHRPCGVETPKLLSSVLRNMSTGTEWMCRTLYSRGVEWYATRTTCARSVRRKKSMCGELFVVVVMLRSIRVWSCSVASVD